MGGEGRDPVGMHDEWTCGPGMQVKVPVVDDAVHPVADGAAIVLDDDVVGVVVAVADVTTIVLDDEVLRVVLRVVVVVVGTCLGWRPAANQAPYCMPSIIHYQTY